LHQGHVCLRYNPTLHEDCMMGGTSVHTRTAATLALLVAGCTGTKVVTPPDADRPVEVRQGDLVIAEIMVAPTDCTASNGQWVELANITDVDLPIAGLRLGNGAADGILTGGTIPANGRVVGAPVGAAPCHGFEPEFRYDPVVWGSDEAARIELLSTQGRVDSVPYGEWGLATGASLQLDPAATSASSNDVESSWCVSIAPIGDGGDFGTPGEANRRCDPVDTSDVDTDVVGPLPIDQLEPGDVVITEIHVSPAGCAPNVAQYLEVVNASGRSIDLDGLVVSDGTNNARAVPGPELTPGGLAFLAVGDVLGNCWLDASLADAFYADSVLFSQTEVISVGYGDPYIPFDTVDLSRIPVIPGASLQLSSNAYDAADNDNPNKWCPSNQPILPGNDAVPDLGTPGLTNRVCDPVDTGFSGPTLLAQDLVPGDLVITEVMVDPENCPDFDAEYFEVYNASGSPIDLQGLEMEINGTVITLSRSYPIPPDTWAVAEYWSGATAAGCYAGLVHDFLFDGNQLPNGGTRIELRNLTQVLDTVDLTDLARQPGAAMTLDPSALDITANDDPSNWCHSAQTFPGSRGDLGTPRAANETCTTSLLDTGVLADTSDTGLPVDTFQPADTFVFDTVPVPTADTGPEPIEERTIDQLSEGDLIFTEAMPEPVGCPQYQAEYIEVYNNTPYRVQLTGLEVVINGQSTVLTQQYSLEPWQYGIGEHTTGSIPSCYTSVIHDFLYTGQRMPDNGTLMQLRFGPVTFDTVNLTGVATQPGAALQLHRGSLDAATNDDPLQWCHATQLFGGSNGDFGTPGAENEPCPGIDDTGPVDTMDTGPEPPPPNLTLADLAPGDLYITEIMAAPNDCSDWQAEYVEIFNATDSTVDPTGLQIGIGGGLQPASRVVPIPPRSYAVARYSTGSAPSCYSIPTDMRYPTARMSDSGTTVRLVGAGITFDEVLGTGWGAFVQGAAAQLDARVTSATGNDDPMMWCPSTQVVPGGVADLGTPGAANGLCSPLIDTSDTGPLPVDSSPLVITADQLDVGDVILTEFHAAPNDCSDWQAEYVEFYNNTPYVLDPTGLQIGIANGLQPVNNTTLVPPGAYAIARYSTGSAPGCYAIGTDMRYPTARMDDDGTRIRLANASGDLDEINAANWPVNLPGAATQLDPRLMDPAANDDVGAWCPSRQLIPGGTADLGTPGAPNDLCAAVVDTSDTGAPPIVDTQPAVLTVNDLVPGDLVITEFMGDPDDCLDFQGEYIEFLNTTPFALDPAGLEIGVGSGLRPVNNSNVIPPGGYAVARYSTGSLPGCYSIPTDMRYPTARMQTSGSDLSLEVAGVVIDAVSPPGWTTLGVGIATSLSPDRLDATSNDSESSWCLATSPVPGGVSDLGTPGQPNDPCGGDTGDTATVHTAHTGASTPLDSADTAAGLPDTGAP
jgi:hypothetical protein